VNFKKLLNIVVFCLISLTIGCGSGEKKADKKATLPDFQLHTLDGELVNFTDFAGSTVVLDFWATWCKPCLHEIPYYNDLNAKYKDKNFKLLGITMASGDAATIQEFAKQNDIQYPLYIGNQQATQAVGGVEGFPKTFIFDQKGNLVKTYLGMHPDKIAEIDKIVGESL